MNEVKISIKEKKKETINLSPQFSVETEQDEEDQHPHVKVIWDNQSTRANIPHIRVMWDNEKPGKVKIEIDGEEKSLNDIHAV